MSCKELGRLKCVATQFNHALIEGSAQLAITMCYRRSERDWLLPQRNGKLWLRTVRELERLTRPPLFRPPRINDVICGSLCDCKTGHFGCGISFSPSQHELLNTCTASRPSTFVCPRGMRAGVHSISFKVLSIDDGEFFHRGLPFCFILGVSTLNQVNSAPRVSA